MSLQLTLRRQGNEHYKLKQFTEALANYNSAKCLLEKAKASQGESQEEVICNLVATELNIAAVHISEQHYGAAIKSCTSALSVDGKNTKALMRRAKAHKGRHNLEVCLLSHTVNLYVMYDTKFTSTLACAKVLYVCTYLL